MPDQRPVEPAPQIVDPFSQQPAQPRAPDGRFAAAGTPAPQPEPAQHPQWLIEQAYDLGISEEDIQALSPDALGRACRQLTKQQQLMRQENSRARAVDLPPTQPAQPAAGSDPWANFNFAEVHPSIAAVLQSQRDEIAKLKGIETEFRQDKEQRVQSERQQNHDMIDDAIADLVSKLGPDGARLYGTKPGRAMDVRPSCNAVASTSPRSTAAEFTTRLRGAIKSSSAPPAAMATARSRPPPPPPRTPTPSRRGQESRARKALSDLLPTSGLKAAWRCRQTVKMFRSRKGPTGPWQISPPVSTTSAHPRTSRAWAFSQADNSKDQP